MNPISEEQLPAAPQPPPQANRKSTSCERHPDEQFTGFCPCCLFERLSILDKSTASTSNTTASASSGLKSGLKSLFKEGGPTLRGKASSSSFLPELRRTKSFSAGKNEGGFLGISGVFEPQRKSCDVRGRSTLFSLFNQDDVNRTAPLPQPQPHPHVIINDRPSTSTADFIQVHVLDDEIQVLEEEIVVERNRNLTTNNNNIKSSELHKDKDKDKEKEKKEEVEKVVDLKPMKYHIDLDSQNKKVGSRDLKDLAGSFWSAASVFSKKLRSWTKKNHHRKIKKNGSQTVEVSVKKNNAGRFNNYRDTQSEIADYGFGRRSCDTDPRFSLDAGRFSVDAATMAGRYSVDAGRFSFDDGRCSFDEPRASWDGYLMGRTFPRMIPPMVSVVEDAPVTVLRKDAQISVEEPRRSSVSVLSQMLVDEPRRSSVSINGDDPIPGGAAQTKDYYSDSSSRRRRSLDRSSSIRKTAAAVVAEMDEMKNGCDAKFHPRAPPCVDYLNGTKVLSGDKDFRELDFHSSSNSLRDDYSESFDLGLRDNASVIGSNCERKGPKKSSRWRAWNLWGLIYRRGTSKDDDEDRETMPNGVERSYSESWQDLRSEGGSYLDPKAPGFGRNVLRSNSSVSWRNSYGSFGSIRKGAMESNGGGRKKDGFVLERNRSGRYSPNHGDNGLLRFYLTPMGGSRRANSGKTKPVYSHSFARSVLRMY